MDEDIVERLTVDQRAAGIAYNATGAWWNSLTDGLRKALKSGNLSMLEYAFKAGVKAGLLAEADEITRLRGEVERQTGILAAAREEVMAFLHRAEGAEAEAASLRERATRLIVAADYALEQW
jgi:hypothetical protein